MARLRRSDCAGPGIRRRGRGRGFEYLDEDGERIEDPETVQRLAELGIPPAWKDVWVCSDPMGHLQATGIDAAGRKQYLYHEHWRLRRDQEKFDRMLLFGKALPRLRKRVDADLGAGKRLERDTVLACAVRLLDHGCFRVGGEDYAAENETYGVATLRRSHVEINDEELDFRYPAKGGQDRHQRIRDREAAELIAVLRRRRSKHPELLAYKEGRLWVDVRSEDINGYVKEAASGDYSAKDFRTWNATVLAAVALAAMGPVPETKTARKRRINDAVKGVASVLGNTPAVCRQSYIDPRVIDQFGDGRTIAPALRRAAPEDVYDPRVRGAIERAVIRLVQA